MDVRWIKIKKPQKGNRSFSRLRINPLPGNIGHDFLQKVRGYGDGFTWLRGETIVKKILLNSWLVKGKNCLCLWK